jgi:hypothetical protein
MIAAWLLTGLAILGITIGAVLGQSRSLSSHLAAAGGGLLSGISVFWLIPEIAESAGGLAAVTVPVALAATLWFADAKVLHASHSLRHGFAAPLLAATAVHSALDGWSIRAVEVQPATTFVALTGLSLHKIAEGLALGWLTRNALQSTFRAIAFCGAAELLTVVGAWLEPLVASLRLSFFGTQAAAIVLMLVAGSFLFLGSHSVIADRRKSGILPAFAAAFAAAGLLAIIKHTGQ